MVQQSAEGLANAAGAAGAATGPWERSSVKRVVGRDWTAAAAPLGRWGARWASSRAVVAREGPIRAQAVRRPRATPETCSAVT